MSSLDYEESRVLGPADQCRRYLRLVYVNEAEWERSKTRFAELKGSYTKGLAKGTAAYADAETRASSDPRIKKAISDCAYHRSEMLAYMELYRLARGFAK
jgi:hypothetical protein